MKDQILYAALGDSITGGMAANLLSGFSYRFYNYLRHKHCNVRYRNLGCPGITSRGLLKQLLKSEETGKAVHKADIITITIGGNNLLKCMRACGTINRRAAESCVEGFREDWPRIMEQIRLNLGSEAQVYVMTLYNPLKRSDPSYEIANYYINRINEAIADPGLMHTYGYIVADVYSCFECNRAKRWTFLYDSIISDPHPNQEGHRQIFSTFKNAYKENNYVA